MPPCIIDRPRGTDDWLLMFFHESVLLEWNHQRRWTESSQLMIWSPGQSHYYGNPEKPWNHSWAHVDGSLLRHFLPRLKIPVNEPMSLSEPHFFEKQLIMMHEEVCEHRSVSARIVSNLFENLLISIQRDITAPRRPSPIPDKFLALKHELDTQFARPVQLK